MTEQAKKYRCLACSYQGKNFPQGSCPACGSANVRRTTASNANATPRVRPAYNLWLCIALWVLLLFSIYNKLTA